ncbi:amino acid ABC transporter permease [Castellaniella caeni]|uniref:amino acid ABC transporter permease n=1 Tax=Castellaniella caeni TaxID=266123 RepID=UPI00082A1374|nr:amino acid ABC transporter permease [Castellaniella caeni]
MMSTLLFLTEAARMTIYVSAAGIIIGFVIAVIVTVFSVSRSPLLQWLSRAYVFIFRGIPLLVQLLVVYLTLPFIGIDVPAAVAAIIAIGFCEGAYIGEILRGGFLAIPAGQIEVAQMLGLKPLATLSRIQLPQVLRMTLPALTNEVILLTKSSSLVSVIGVAEITLTAQNISSSNYKPLEVFSLAAIVYIVLCGAIAFAGRYLENRYAEAK